MSAGAPERRAPQAISARNNPLLQRVRQALAPVL